MGRSTPWRRSSGGCLAPALVLLLILIAAPAFAGWFSLNNGYYSNGDGRAYSYRNGQYCFAYVIAVAPTPPAYTKGWRAAYFDYLTAKADYDSYNATVAATAPPLAERQLVRPLGSYLSSYSSSTQFGYSSGRSVGEYNRQSPQIDWNLVMGDFGRTEDHQADNLATAHGLRGELLKDLRLAEIERDRQIATQAAIVNAANAPRLTTQRTEYKAGEQPAEVNPPLATSKAKALSTIPTEALSLKTILLKNCAGCHSGPTPAKGFDVMARVFDDNDAKFNEAAKLVSDAVSQGLMPLAADRKTAKPLAAEQIKAVNAGLQALGASLNVVEAE